MFWPTHFAARLQRVLRPAAQPSRAHQTSADTELVQQTQTALGLLLGLSDSDALVLACTVLAHRQTLLAVDRPTHKAATPSGLGRQAGPPDGGTTLADSLENALKNALTQGSCLLALPCNVPALQCLGHLLQADVAPVVLVDSPALRPLLAALPQLWTRPTKTWRCCSPIEVIGQVKAGRSAATPATLYISLPELHGSGASTSAQVKFLGQTLRWSLLEPLLCLQGLQTLLTLAPSVALPSTSPSSSLSTPSTVGNSGSQALSVVSRASRHPGLGLGADSPGAILAWLVGHLETSARSLPGLTLSWPQLYRASAPFQAISRSNRLKQMAAFFDAWQAAGAGLRQQTQVDVAARLALLRSSV